MLKLLELNLHLALNMPSLTQWLFFASEAIRSAPEIVQQFSQVIDSWRILWATAQMVNKLQKFIQIFYSNERLFSTNKF